MSDYVFFGNQDLGALGYDRWKEDVPEYYGDDECDHDDAEFDTLDGELRCHCGYSRSLTAAECDAEIRRMGEYDALMAREERRRRWRDLTLPVRRFFGRLFGSGLPKPLFDNDEIPF